MRGERCAEMQSSRRLRLRATGSRTPHAAWRHCAHSSHRIKAVFIPGTETPYDSRRGVRPNKGKERRALVCAPGAAPAARSKAARIKGAAARSASVIIIMQALRSAWVGRGRGREGHASSPRCCYRAMPSGPAPAHTRHAFCTSFHFNNSFWQTSVGRDAPPIGPFDLLIYIYILMSSVHSIRYFQVSENEPFDVIFALINFTF